MEKAFQEVLLLGHECDITAFPENAEEDTSDGALFFCTVARCNIIKPNLLWSCVLSAFFFFLTPHPSPHPQSPPLPLECFWLVTLQKLILYPGYLNPCIRTFIFFPYSASSPRYNSKVPRHFLCIILTSLLASFSCTSNQMFFQKAK